MLLAAFWLAGCATPAGVPVGAEQAAVLARVGAPAERHALPAGERWVYPGGGLQQQTWMVDVDQSGHVVQVRQALAMEHFMRVRVGVDTTADIRREFGPPRLAQEFARVNLTAWLYAYQEDGLWNSEMAIYFDPQGIVRRIENGPDPRFLGNGGNRSD
jgi:hypothetical protein